jgi:hypothetical protein
MCMTVFPVGVAGRFSVWSLSVMCYVFVLVHVHRSSLGSNPALWSDPIGSPVFIAQRMSRANGRHNDEAPTFCGDSQNAPMGVREGDKNVLEYLVGGSWSMRFVLSNTLTLNLCVDSTVRRVDMGCRVRAGSQAAGSKRHGCSIRGRAP